MSAPGGTYVGDVLFPSMIVAVAAALVATGTFAADVKSVSRLAFGPDNILFVADWKGAQVHALTLPAPVLKKGEGTFNVLDLEALLSKSLGAGKVKVEDIVDERVVRKLEKEGLF